jgi:hypothetical protein
VRNCEKLVLVWLMHLLLLCSSQVQCSDCSEDPVQDQAWSAADRTRGPRRRGRLAIGVRAVDAVAARQHGELGGPLHADDSLWNVPFAGLAHA